MTVTADEIVTKPDLYELELGSLRKFVESCAQHLTGRVLDYGCGERPYRDLVTGRYHGYDREDYPGNVSGEDLGVWPFGRQRWDAILCTQVVQYVPNVPALLRDLREVLNPGGRLIVTFPTCWPEAEETDLHRFTRAGMWRRLTGTGFVVEREEMRAAVDVGPFSFPLGYGMVARR